NNHFSYSISLFPFLSLIWRRFLKYHSHKSLCWTLSIFLILTFGSVSFILDKTKFHSSEFCEIVINSSFSVVFHVHDFGNISFSAFAISLCAYKTGVSSPTIIHALGLLEIISTFHFAAISFKVWGSRLQFVNTTCFVRNFFRSRIFSFAFLTWASSIPNKRIRGGKSS